VVVDVAVSPLAREDSSGSGSGSGSGDIPRAKAGVSMLRSSVSLWLIVGGGLVVVTLVTVGVAVAAIKRRRHRRDALLRQPQRRASGEVDSEDKVVMYTLSGVVGDRVQSLRRASGLGAGNAVSASGLGGV
jgi:hypothetical protein